MYVVEAVAAPHRAYTVVIVSDVGLVSKAAPGQILLYAADRVTGNPGGRLRREGAGQPAAAGRRHDGRRWRVPGDDGLHDGAMTIVSVARCGEQVTASDPGSWYLRENAARTGRLRLHRQAHLPAGPHRAREGPAAVARSRRPADVRRARRGSARVGRDRQGDLPAASDRRCLRGRVGRYSARRRRRARRLRDRRSSTAKRAPAAAFEVQEYRKPEFEVTRLAGRSVRRAGSARCTATVTREVLLRPACRGRQGHLRRAPAALLLAAAVVRRRRRGRRWQLLVRRRPGPRKAKRDSTPAARAAIDDCHGCRRAGARLHTAHRGPGHRRQQPRGRGQHVRPRDRRAISDRRRARHVRRTSRRHRDADSQGGDVYRDVAGRRFPSTSSVLARPPGSSWDETGALRSVASARRDDRCRRPRARGRYRCRPQPATTAFAPAP